MNLLNEQVRSSPALVRAVPFVIFLALTFCQGYFGEAGRYWFYLAKTLVGAWLIFEMRPLLAEMRWAFSWEAVAAGVGVFVLWIGLGPFLKMLGVDPAFALLSTKADAVWNPHATFGENSALAWLFIVARTAGSSLVVPPLEEVFFRSFVYRFIAKDDFLSVPLGQFLRTPFFATSILFGFEHNEWLAGILCGFAYQALVLRKQRLGDAITAHAITNFLLALWVVWKGAWSFW